MADPALADDDAAFDAAADALFDETRRLATIPARTLEGLILEARWAARWHDDLRASIVADLVAMA